MKQKVKHIIINDFIIAIGEYIFMYSLFVWDN
jgi:hypothetical protein